MPDPQVPASLKEMKRRELLKTLAGGGVLGASIILPGKWTRPLINKGLLPGHAQTSQPLVCPIISDPAFEFINQQENWIATFTMPNVPVGVNITSVEVRGNNQAGAPNLPATVTVGTSTDIDDTRPSFTATFTTLDYFPYNGQVLFLVVTLSAAITGCGQVFDSPEFTFIDQRPT